MPIETLPPVTPNTSLLTPISEWGTKLVAPLGSSLMSKDGMLELAGRVYWIVGLVILTVWAAKNGYLTGRVTPPSKKDSTIPIGKNFQTSSEKDGANPNLGVRSSADFSKQSTEASGGASSGSRATQTTVGSLQSSSVTDRVNTNETNKTNKVFSKKSSQDHTDSSTNPTGGSTIPQGQNLQGSSGKAVVNTMETNKSREVFTKKSNGSQAPTGTSLSNPEVFSNVSAGNLSIVSGVVVNNSNPTGALNNGDNKKTTSESNILMGSNTPMSDTFLTDSLTIVDLLAKPTFQALSKTIAGDVEKIHENFNLCSIKLQSCKTRSPEFQGLIVDFKRKIVNFCKIYGPYERDFDQPHFLNVKQYERILIELNDISRGIIRVKGDGNCLFYSFAKAFGDIRVMTHLRRFNVWHGRLLNHESLRYDVNAYMQKHFESDTTLKNLIDDAIIAHVEAKKSDISLKKESEQCTLDNAQQLIDEGFEINKDDVNFTLQQLQAEENSLVEFEGPSKYQLYFNQFEELGFFAAFAAAYSMCKILEDQIGIRIAFEPKDQITTVYDAFNEKAPILITLVFKGDHFDVQFPEGFI